MCPRNAKIPSACCLRMWSRKTDPNSGRLLCCQAFLAMSSFHFQACTYRGEKSCLAPGPEPSLFLPPSLSESSERPLLTEQLGLDSLCSGHWPAIPPCALDANTLPSPTQGIPCPCVLPVMPLIVFSSPLEPRWLAFTSFSSASLSAGFSS